MSEHQQIELERFAEHYDYNVDYLRALLAASPAGFAVFLPIRAMSSFRETLPLDAHFIARIATMQTVDCGACAQLNLKMACEAGVPQELLRALLEAPDRLPEPLQDVRDHARAVASGTQSSEERLERLRNSYGRAGVAELALCIAASQVYPSLKRGLGLQNGCALLRLDDV